MVIITTHTYTSITLRLARLEQDKQLKKLKCNIAFLFKRKLIFFLIHIEGKLSVLNMKYIIATVL